MSDRALQVLKSLCILLIMPFISGTPESLIPRSDSKNPATTCKGIISSGRPCRRSLASSPGASPRSSPRNGGRGVLAMVSNVGENHEGAAAYFCWQHKDQATNLNTGSGNTQVFELKERSSIDTLVNRLGVLDVKDKDKKKKRRKNSLPESGAGNQAIRRDTLLQTWQGVSGPLMSVPEDPFNTQSQTQPQSEARPPQRRRRNGELHLSFFCCMRQPSEEQLPPARPRPTQQLQSQSVSIPSQRSIQLPLRPTASTQSQPNVHSTQSQTQRFLSYIPHSLPPNKTSALLSELAKPLTPSDHEPGYIYIFWLTPTSVPQQAAKDASSLLAPPSLDRSAGRRRPSDVLREFDFEAYSSSDTTRSVASSSKMGSKSGMNKTIMLKIGRASNVHRRMNEWSRQCGHHITLLRYYPNANQNSPSPSPSSSPAHSPRPSSYLTPTLATTGGQATTPPATPSTPQKAPFIPRVERLIHTELAEQRIMRACDGCGKQHREWFEVEASRDGVRAVDEVVRRWIGWGINEGGMDLAASRSRARSLV